MPRAPSRNLLAVLAQTSLAPQSVAPLHGPAVGAPTRRPIGSHGNSTHGFQSTLQFDSGLGVRVRRRFHVAPPETARGCAHATRTAQNVTDVGGERGVAFDAAPLFEASFAARATFDRVGATVVAPNHRSANVASLRDFVSSGAPGERADPVH